MIGRDKGQYFGHGLLPPVQATQIGLLHVKAATGQMHACQHGAYLRAMVGSGLQFAFTCQKAHHTARPPLQAVQQLALRIGGRVGHGYAVLREVTHQAQVIRKLLGA